ncbi:MAG: cyclic beta 1-2 glucan synthetase, partial [Gammaproteobacteria bacterium]
MLRSELFSIEQLKRHALTLAEQHRIDPRPGPDRLLRRLADTEQVLLTAYDVVTAAALPAQRIAPAEAWLLDNFYLIEQQIAVVRRHLPRGYSRQLPRLVDGSLTGFPRVYDLALELISHMDGRVDNDNATQFIATYQTIDPLRLGELWAFPIMLQLALLENLRRVGVRIAQRREERDAAVTWADRMLAAAEGDRNQLIHLLAEFADADVPLTAPFVEEFYDRLQAQGTAMAFVQTWVEQKLLEQGVTATELSEADGRTAAADQISVANSIGSLRFIGATDWTRFVESLSLVEQSLRKDPLDCHANQDFATRDRYRHAIEDIARHSAASEWAVARAALALAQATRSEPDERRTHVGYYLIDKGRAQLERAVGCRPPWTSRICRVGQHVRLFLYLGAIALLTSIAVAIVVSALGGFDSHDERVWLLALPLLIAASALAVPLVNRLVTLVLPPRAVPRMDFSTGIPERHRTMVIVPTLLNRPQDVDHLLEAMEIRYLGNRDPNLFFALLT